MCDCVLIFFYTYAKFIVICKPQALNEGRSGHHKLTSVGKTYVTY